MMDARAIFERVEHETELDVVAITDHEEIGGALAARELYARGRYRFELVTGIELTTRSGHLLALFVDEPLRPLRPLAESVAEIHRRGGLAVLPHPLSYLTRSIGQRTLERLLGGSVLHPRYNLGSDNSVTLDEMIATIEEVLGRSAQTQRLPMQPGDVRQTWADLSRSRAELG